MTTDATPQSMVEHALAASVADDCIAIVTDATRANLRWANNTLTTNGVMHAVDVTVISFARVTGGVGTGSVSGSATTAAQVTALVEAADAAARAGSPAEDAAELATGDPAAALGAAGCSTASCRTSTPRPTSARRPACGCATCSPPVTGRAPPRTPR